MASFVDTPAGRVPVVRTRPTWTDRVGTCRVRLGLSRDLYAVPPGLYAVGNPHPESPVLVTANYKLSFDTLRFSLQGRNAWILVTDTRGINVWCAGGKGLFSSGTVSEIIRSSSLDRVVSNRMLILPQLSANGVRAADIRRATGFDAVFGPVRAEDLPSFLDGGMRAFPAMRATSFGLRERAVLIPVELVLLWKFLALLLLALLLLAAILPGPFGLWWSRLNPVLTASLAGIVGGTVLVPLLLPFMPLRHFSVNGALLSALVWIVLQSPIPGLPIQYRLGLGLWATALGSWQALSFTGSTTFTSPSGVEREMRRAIPFIGAGGLIALALAAWGLIGWSMQ
ncbi:MAG: hypothetical protein EOM25_02125 [Deltaproteobacteria bacterium]|nr:hypothetical protein [Deltaproteobacteria bacterium]